MEAASKNVNARDLGFASEVQARLMLLAGEPDVSPYRVLGGRLGSGRRDGEDGPVGHVRRFRAVFDLERLCQGEATSGRRFRDREKTGEVLAYNMCVEETLDDGVEVLRCQLRSRSSIRGGCSERPSLPC